MHIDDKNWTYNEFLAFLMIYAAEMNYDLSPEEIDFIKQKTGIADIDKIKDAVHNASDIEAIEVIEDYRKLYLHSTEQEQKVRQDLEELLKSQNNNSQFENALVHILERII